MKKLLLIVLLLGCEGILSPEFHLEGEWERFLTITTNTETGNVHIVEQECGGVFRLLSDGRFISGYRTAVSSFGVTDSTCISDTIYYNGRASWSWSADVNKIYFNHHEGPRRPGATDEVDYSFRGDTLIWATAGIGGSISSEGSGYYHQSYHKRLESDRRWIYLDIYP